MDNKRNIGDLTNFADGAPVAAMRGSLLVLVFHPELTSNLSFHAYSWILYREGVYS